MIELFPTRISKSRLFALVVLAVPVLVTACVGALAAPAITILTVLAAVLVVVVLFFPAPVDIRMRFCVSVGLCIGVLSIQALLPVLTGPDAREYYQQLTNYSAWQLIQNTYDAIDFHGHPVSALLSFPALTKSFLGGSVSLGPSVAGFVNVLFLLLAAFSWLNALVSKMADMPDRKRRRLYNIFFVLFLLSPSSLYWSGALNKDIVTMAVTVLSATAFIKKRYVAAIVWLILGTLLRPYVIAIVAAYVAFLSPNKWLKWGAVAGAYGVILIVSKASLWPVINSVGTAVYFFLSPNPTDPSNWLLFKDTGTWVFSPLILTAGGVFYGVSWLVGAAMFVFKPRLRPVFVSLGVAIIICSCALVLVGFERTHVVGIEYGFMTFGDNFVRKKLIAWPLITTWAAYCITYLVSGRQRVSNLNKQSLAYAGAMDSHAT